MDVNEAARLYASGMTLKAVGARLGGYDPRSVSFQLERAGIPRRSWNPRTGGARYTARVVTSCGFCGGRLEIRRYHFETGNRSRADPRPRHAHYHRECWRLAQRVARGLGYPASVIFGHAKPRLVLGQHKVKGKKSCKRKD